MLNGAITTVAGNLTRDPELRHSSANKAWLVLRIAVNRRVGYAENTTERTSYMDVKIFGAPAENLSESELRKGDRILATGVLEMETWTDRQGEERSGAVLYADEVAVSTAFTQVTPHRTSRASQRPASDAEPTSAPTQQTTSAEPPAPLADGDDPFAAALADAPF